jgi:hypothetical protein
MMNVTDALIGLAGYFAAIFAFGLLWRKREALQRSRNSFDVAAGSVGRISRVGEKSSVSHSIG